MTDRKIPVPLNESARLEALKSLQIMDTPPSEVFDEITQAAASSYDTPIALVSLLDAQRQLLSAELAVANSEVGFLTDVVAAERALNFYPFLEPDEETDALLSRIQGALAPSP